MNQIPPSNLSSAPSPISETKKENSFNKKTEDLSHLFNIIKSTFKSLTEIKIKREKIINEIRVLDDEIKHIEKSLKDSKQNTPELKNEPSKTPLVGTLVNEFYNSTNRIHDFKVQKSEYEQKLKALRLSLVSVEKKKIDKIFELESQIRILLEKDFPEKEKYQKIYLQNVLPLVQEIKQSLIQRPFQFVAQAAAAKGKAAQAGLQALKQLAENKPVMKNGGVSTQEVFLLPEEGVVFKHSNERAKEEERLVNDLLDLMSKQAVVGIFNIQHVSADKFGIQFSEGQARGFTADDLSKSPSIRDGIEQKLSDHDRLLLKKHEATPTKVDTALENYENVKKQTWFIKPPGKDGEWESVSFSDLQKLNLVHQLPAGALIGTAPESDKILSFQDHLLKETDFARALNYLPALHSSPNTLYFSPDLSNPEIRKAYETCEKYQWRYVDENGKSHKVDFKTLQTLCLQKTKMKGVLRPIQNKELLPHSQTYYFNTLAKQALDANWKAISPELMHVDATGGLANLKDIQAKPFIGDMILMHQLDSNTKEVILQRLTPDAEFNAVLTGEVQLLDMHAKNLGIAPQSNAEYERYTNFEFSISSSPPLSLQNLIIGYLRGYLPPDTIIKFEEEGKTITKPLKDLPELQKALDVHWQFVIFDTDLSLSEDNRLQLQTRGGVEEHLIPLRSALLETNWKDRPLSKKAIQTLMNSAERDLRVADWIKRADAPIYKQLSPSARQSVKQQVAPLIQEYTLSEPRKKDPATMTTIKSLQDQFIQKLSDITQPNHLAIWQTLEKDLSSVAVRPEDTWEKIAQRYHQDPIELSTLNPQGLKPGEKIKIKYDLTSSAAEAAKKREMIAPQLFPRLTQRQQAALIERQQRRRDYLNNYQALFQSTLTGKELLDQIKQFVQRAETPMNSIEKEKFFTDCEAHEASILSSPTRLSNIKQFICKICQPTYFNLMKVMYPLLSDAYVLNEIAYRGDQATAGQSIGSFNAPLEKMISHVKASFPHDSIEVRLAKNLEDQIGSIRNPAFFGHW